MPKETTNTATEAVDTQSNLLDSFGFDKEVEFFGIKEGGSGTGPTDVKTVADNIKNTATDQEVEDAKETKEDNKDTKASAKKKPDEDVEVEDDKETTFFEDSKSKKPEATKTNKDTDVGKSEKDNKEDAVDEDKFYSTLATELKDKGIFSVVEIPEDKNLTEDEFIELHDQEIEGRVDETLKGFFSKFDDEDKDLLKFLTNGGKARDFVYASKPSIAIDEFDADNPAHIDMVVDHHLRTVEGLDGEDLIDRKQYLKENKKDTAYAEKWYTAAKKVDDKRKAEAIKAQDAINKSKAEQVESFNEEIREILTTTDTIGAFKISKTEQKELNKYMTKPVVKVDKDKYIPTFHVDLGRVLKAASKEDKQKLIIIGKLLYNDFDISDIVTTMKTKVTERAKSKLEEAKTGRDLRSSGSGTEGKDLSSYF